MEGVSDDYLTDGVIALLATLRDGSRELRGIEMDAPIQHLTEKRIELTYQAVEGTNDAETALSALKGFLEAAATSESSNDRINRSFFVARAISLRRLFCVIGPAKCSASLVQSPREPGAHVSPA